MIGVPECQNPGLGRGPSQGFWKERREGCDARTQKTINARTFRDASRRTCKITSTTYDAQPTEAIPPSKYNSTQHRSKLLGREKSWQKGGAASVQKGTRLEAMILLAHHARTDAGEMLRAAILWRLRVRDKSWIEIVLRRISWRGSCGPAGTKRIDSLAGSASDYDRIKVVGESRTQIKQVDAKWGAKGASVMKLLSTSKRAGGSSLRIGGVRR
ncbi:hypothetical protein C8R44DRAFT_753113 [Mycena epipterygia]|nr:hypothetical protein C8R44DRAFT_753113 [Mycena epipterygia]